MRTSPVSLLGFVFLFVTVTACESQLGAMEAQRYVSPTGTSANCTEQFVTDYNNVLQGMNYPGYYASLDQEQAFVTQFSTLHAGIVCNAETIGTDPTTLAINVQTTVAGWNGIIASVRNGTAVPSSGEGLKAISVIQDN